MSTRVVFMGSPDFALPSLRGLATNYQVVGVVTQPDRPAGRGRQLTPPPVKTLALELGLPVMQPRRLRESHALDQLRAWAPDVIVVAAFGQILRAEVLGLPPHGCINVHASLLPRWRGASPIVAAILAGDRQTGITIMLMDAGLDTGPVLSQRAITISPDDSAGSISDKLAPLGAQLLLEILPGYLSGKLQPKPQPESGVTTAPLLEKSDGALDFSQPAAVLERKVRAFNPWPGAFTVWRGRQVKIHRARIVAGKKEVGSRSLVDGYPAVACGDGLLILEEIQPAGKRSMSGREFIIGTRDWLI